MKKLDRELLRHALTRFALGLVLLGGMLFLSAWTLAWEEAWLLLGLLFIPMLLIGVLLLVYEPELLRARLRLREKRRVQQSVQATTAVLFVLVFISAGLNRRFLWLSLPAWTVTAAAVVFGIGYLLYAETLRENLWLSRTVEVRKGQKLIDTGLYANVRHPMYAASALMALSMPLILNAPLSAIAMLVYLPLLSTRMADEERLLIRRLPGYADYCERVPWRMIPQIW
jgi:protein-S-isoprenylcysteine O-methyltransferase Ste14